MKKILAVCLVLVLLAGCSPRYGSLSNVISSSESSESLELEPITPEPVVESSESTFPTLGIGLFDFVEKVNSKFANLETDLWIDFDSMELSTGQAEYSTRNGNINFVFHYITTSDMYEIDFVGFGDGTTESGIDIMYSLAALCMAADDTLPQNESGDFVLDLIEDEIAFRNGIIFTYSTGEIGGSVLKIMSL